MKITNTIILFLILSLSLNSQTNLEPDWIKIESSNIGNAEAWGICADETGNIFWTSSVEIDELGYDLKSYKLASDGTMLWEDPFIFEDQGTQQAYINVINDSHLYIGGRNCPFLINSCDMHIIKLDKNTKEVDWSRTLNFAGNGYDEIDAIHLGTDGIYCGGWVQQLQSSPFQTDIGLWKLDYEGNTDWVNYLGKEDSAEHIDGHFVVDDERIFAAGLWNGTGISNLYNGNAFLGAFAKTDGSLLDSVLFGNQSDEFLDIENALGMTTDGEYLYITGYATPISTDDWQLFIAKYDKQLNQIWYTDWGGNETESGRGIKIKDNKIYIAGLSESESIISNEVERKGVLLTADLDGNILEYKTWGQDQKTNFHDLDLYEQNIYITGTTEENEIKKGFLLALNDEISLVQSNNEKIDFEIFPNPANGQIGIRNTNIQNEILHYTIIDNQGRIIKLDKLESITKLKLNSNGIYYINVSNGKYSITKKIINWH